MSSQSTVTPVKTALYDLHVASGAKMVDFAGWDMPIEYGTGIKREHEAVRQSAGIFDLSHMGEVWFEGPTHLEFLQSLFSNDLSKISSGRAQYGTMCNEQGLVLDDMIIYRDVDKTLVVVNASNREKMVDWMKSHLVEGVQMTDRSMQTALIALQGPLSQSLLEGHYLAAQGVALNDIPYYGFSYGKVFGVDCLVARTGYTGEDGFELYCDWDQAAPIWKSLLDLGIAPIGLGARDTLRLESGYSLYGHEIDQTITPLDASLGWVVKFDKEFMGKAALQARKESGQATCVVGLMMDGRAIPREGYAVFQDGKKVGKVTSGTFSPSLKKGIALARVESSARPAGTALTIEIRERHESAVVTRTPFVKGSVRKG